MHDACADYSVEYLLAFEFLVSHSHTTMALHPIHPLHHIRTPTCPAHHIPCTAIVVHHSRMCPHIPNMPPHVPNTVHNQIYLLDKMFSIFGYTLSLTVVEYQSSCKAIWMPWRSCSHQSQSSIETQLSVSLRCKVSPVLPNAKACTDLMIKTDCAPKAAISDVWRSGLAGRSQNGMGPGPC